MNTRSGSSASKLAIGVLFATEDQLCAMFGVDTERVRDAKLEAVGTYHPPGRGGQALYSVRKAKEALGATNRG